MNRERIIELLSAIHNSCTEGINGQWDKSDDGFQSMQYCIELLATELSIESKELETYANDHNICDECGTAIDTNDLYCQKCSDEFTK